MTAVDTSQGRIVGEDAGGVRVFRGVPFAAPLSPATRFLPPEPPAPQAVIDATRFGPPAPQLPDPLDRVWGEVLAPGDEGCLTLNVWAPPHAPGDPARPVVVWVHGGAFIIGSGRWPWYEATRLVRRTGVVFVTVNYRLGAFGFLDLSEVGGNEVAGAANLGLLDQVRALEWARDHIGAFGGDPGNVTLAGQSAGGSCVACLMGCPRAKGLFHKALAMSGAGNLVRSPEAARRVARRVLRAAGAGSVADLRKLSVAELLAAQKAAGKGADGPAFGPVVDGDVLPVPPLDAIRDGSAAGVPLLTGTTRDEFRLWGLYVPPLRRVGPEALTPWLARVVGGRSGARELVALYRARRAGRPEWEAAAAVLGDAIFRLPVVRLAEAQAGHRADTRVYRFDWPTPAAGGWLGAPHALEAAVLFGNFARPGASLLTGEGPEQERMCDLLQDTVAAFARTGDPSHPGLPAWPGYEPGRRATMLLNTRCEVAADPDGPERAVWDGVPFDGANPAADNLPRRRELLVYLLNRAARRLAVPVAVAAAAVAAAVWWRW